MAAAANRWQLTVRCGQVYQDQLAAHVFRGASGAGPTPRHGPAGHAPGAGLRRADAAGERDAADANDAAAGEHDAADAAAGERAPASAADAAGDRNPTAATAEEDACRLGKKAGSRRRRRRRRWQGSFLTECCGRRQGRQGAA
jgi:hypothetical protein